jgi:hypothetical protein
MRSFGEAEERWALLDAEFRAYPDNLASLLRQYVEANATGYRSWPGT